MTFYLCPNPQNCTKQRMKPFPGGPGQWLSLCAFTMAGRDSVPGLATKIPHVV